MEEPRCSDIPGLVADAYWKHDHNCAVTTLLVLSRLFDLPLEHQVLDSAVGMHGAGGYRAQCGLVEGTLMFFGVYGGRCGTAPAVVAGLCRTYAEEFVRRFGSLTCRELRPGGFRDDDPPHLCTDLTVRSIDFSTRFFHANQGGFDAAQ